MTPEIKSLLRKKNELMHTNRIEQASAIAAKIGKLIARHNSVRLSAVSAGSSMWDEVRKLTGASNSLPAPATLTAESLNTHYCGISTDPLYHPPDSKITVSYSTLPFTEYQVFRLLDRLSPTSPGPDNLPVWFLRIAAPLISRPLTHIFNLSVFSSTVPTQWKAAVIRPIPKISAPVEPSHMRPISVVSILSRLAERLIVREFVTPLLIKSPSLSNQFAYKPTGSTTAALISILAQVTHLLQTNSHVIVLIFDYSKAFDTLSHTSVANVLSTINIPDSIFNWTLNYLANRTHYTNFNGQSSSTASITAGVIQGSVLGPTLFNLTASTLTPFSSQNSFAKYADDGYLMVPGSNASSIPAELAHHSQWAAEQNLKLNLQKHQRLFSRLRGKLKYRHFHQIRMYREFLVSRF